MPVNRIAQVLGQQLPKYEEARINMAAQTGFGIYKPLQDRIKLVMNNIASNQEIYGIDPSVAKAAEGVDSGANPA